MTRSEAIEIVQKSVKPATFAELEERAAEYNAEPEEDRDGETMDALDAFAERAQRAEEMADGADIGDADEIRDGKKMVAEFFPALIALGMYQPISDEDARESVRNGLGVKMKHFPKFAGRRYQSVSTWQGISSIGR